MNNIIEKMMQYQSLKSLVDQLDKEIEDTMDNNIDTDQYSYHGFCFRSIKNGIVSFYGYHSYSCGTETYDYELPVDEFVEIITGKKKLKYKG